jgi:hypothetical protein
MRGLAFAAAALLAACRTVDVDMRVIIEPPAYVASMSSTLGLGLTPVSEQAPGVKVRYRWSADGGYFLTQSETTSEIVNLGRAAVTEGGKLFWSYDPNGQKALEDRPVAITVITESLKNGKEIGRTEFALVWDGQFFRAKH